MPERLDDIRPLLAGTVSWEPDAAIVELGLTEVRVRGDVDVLQRVLGDCDGRSTVAELATRHGSVAGALLARLIDQGAIIDAEQAWRVLHRQSSVGSALGRAIGAAELAVLQRGAFAPPGALEDTESISLVPAASTVGSLAARRRSATPAEASTPATFAALSAVLAAAYSVRPAGPGTRTGTVPSAGALYPLAVHVLLREQLGGAAPGLWWMDPRARRLRRIGDPPVEAAALLVDEPACNALVARGQPIVFLSADLARPSRKYGARGYRYALIEAGAAMQAAHLTATELGLPLRTIGGIDDRAIHRFLDLPDTAVALLALLVGT